MGRACDLTRRCFQIGHIHQLRQVCRSGFEALRVPCSRAPWKIVQVAMAKSVSHGQAASMKDSNAIGVNTTEAGPCGPE
jgi:hypothetical protein